MQSLVSLKGYDPELRSYLVEHRWPAIMEVKYRLQRLGIICYEDELGYCFLTGAANRSSGDVASRSLGVCAGESTAHQR